jgi:hypothetical protein
MEVRASADVTDLVFHFCMFVEHDAKITTGFALFDY